MAASPADAQNSPSWTYPLTIPGLIDIGIPPVLLADSEGAIHIFHSQIIGGTVSIMYTRWSSENGWSHLVDIITSPRGDARIHGAILDQKGWFHLIFWGGDEFGADIYYTKAPAVNANKSTAWTEPVLIGKSALDPAAAALVMDENNTLVVVYGSKLRGNGLYTTQSIDEGKTWSSPQPFFITYKRLLWPTALKLYADRDGFIFAVWAVGDYSGNGLTVYFSKRTLSTQQWTTPITIAEAIGFEADTPSLIRYENDLIMIYHNNQPTTRWMRTSSDHGDTWSQPVRLFKHVGSNGAASLVIDNNNNLHMFFGNRIGSPSIHGAWHSRWLEEQWSNPEAITSGPQIILGPHREEGFDPSFLQATTSRGNLLFVIWRHDPMAGPINIWYSYQTIDAPESPMIPLVSTNLETPTYTVEPTETQWPTLAPTPTLAESDQPIPSISLTPEAQANNPNTNILIGIVPIVLLLFVVIILQSRGK